MSKSIKKIEKIRFNTWWMRRKSPRYLRRGFSSCCETSSLWHCCGWCLLRGADQPGHVLWADAKKVLARVVRGGGGSVLRRRQREQQQQHPCGAAGLRPVLQDWHSGGQWRQQPVSQTHTHTLPRVGPLAFWLGRGDRLWKRHSAQGGDNPRPGGLICDWLTQEAAVWFHMVNLARAACPGDGLHIWRNYSSFSTYKLHLPYRLGVYMQTIQSKPHNQTRSVPFVPFRIIWTVQSAVPLCLICLILRYRSRRESYTN